MALFRSRRQERPSDMSLELQLSPISSTAGHGSSTFNGIGGDQSDAVKPHACDDEACTLLPPERAPLLSIVEAYEQTSAAESARGDLAVAPALEPYIGATHYSSGDPLPPDLLKEVAMTHPDRYKDHLCKMYPRQHDAALDRFLPESESWNWMELPSVAIVAAFYTFLAMLVSPSNMNSDACGLAGSWIRWALLAPIPILHFALSLTVLAAVAFDKAPPSFNPLNPKSHLVEALYFLYCEHKCRELPGLPGEVVHKVMPVSSDSRTRTTRIYSVYGDGHVSLRERPTKRG